MMAAKAGVAESGTLHKSSSYDTTFLQKTIDRGSASDLDRFMKHCFVRAAQRELVDEVLDDPNDSDLLKSLIGAKLEKAEPQLGYLLGIFSYHLENTAEFDENRGEARVQSRILHHAVKIMTAARKAGHPIPGMGDPTLAAAECEQNAYETVLSCVFSPIVEYACLPRRDRYHGFNICKIIPSWAEKQKEKKALEHELDFVELGTGPSEASVDKGIADLQWKAQKQLGNTGKYPEPSTTGKPDTKERPANWRKTPAPKTVKVDHEDETLFVQQESSLSLSQPRIPLMAKLVLPMLASRLA